MAVLASLRRSNVPACFRTRLEARPAYRPAGGARSNATVWASPSYSDSMW